MKQFFYLILISIFCCCNNETPKQLIEEKFINFPDSTEINYFPADSLFFSQTRKFADKDSFLRGWYSNILYNLKEPVLYNYRGKGEAIRLVWIRPFKNTIAIRLNNFNDTIYANLKELALNNQTKETPVIIRDTIIPLSLNKWQEAISTLNDNNFLNVITEDTTEHNLKDGIAWFLESQTQNKYHCIERIDDGNLTAVDFTLYAKLLFIIADSLVDMRSAR